MSLAAVLSTQPAWRTRTAEPTSETAGPQVIERDKLWVPVPLTSEAPPGRASSKVGDQGSGERKMKNRPNSGPKTEAKLDTYSVHCLSLPFQEMVQEELSRVGSKTGVGDS